MDGDQLPNILITGTPGTGKTSLCRALVEGAPELRHFDVSSMVKNDPALQDGFDEESQAYFLNEDKIVDVLETEMARGGCVVDTHSLIDYFPERWFSLVVCLQTDNTVLFDRLVKRGYSEAKVSENVECEIMHVCADEAAESYDAAIVQFLPSNTPEDMESNAARILQWLHNTRLA